jgi:hypothetical protein
MSDSPSTPPNPSRPGAHKGRRLRGAPLNNLNALKHGFYARKFRPTDLVDLAESSFTGLNEEMTMLRVFMRGVIEKSSNAASLPESIEILRVLSLAAASLTRMARTQKYLDSGGPGRNEQLLNQAIDEVLLEFQKKGAKE